jgi:predicted ATPase
VGRQREMDQLREALMAAQSGRGRLIMLVGEPGIGKTRTARELTSHAEADGARVLWGWCYEEAGAPPYWLWIQPLRSYIQQQDPDQLRSQMGLGAADIAEIIPKVREKLPILETPPTLEPEQARFRIFGSITTFLKSTSQDQPSLLSLQFLARKLVGSRILVVGCYRDVEVSLQHPLSDAMAQLSKEPVFRRLVLQGVSEEETARFIEQEVGIRPPLEVVKAIYALTEGNPLYV